jgi:protein-tyrosine phosphatase
MKKNKFIENKNKIIFVKCDICDKEIENNKLHIHLESHPGNIDNFIYIGSYFNATNSKELDKLNIKYILNCAIECKNLFEYKFIYKKIDLKDLIDFPIENYFDEAIEFINKCREEKKGNLLIHCMQGKSRSATILLAYLIKENKMTTNEAFKFVKKKRKTILPNLSFMNKLREFEEKLNNK